MAESGATADDFMDMVMQASSTEGDVEFLSAVVVGALMILCPMYEYLVEDGSV